MYIPHNRAPKYFKQNLTEWKGEMGNATIIVEEVNTLILIMVIISM